MVKTVKVKVVDARADYKGRLKLQFRVGDQFYLSTLSIVSIAEGLGAKTPRAMIECDIVKATTSKKRMKL